MTNLWRASAVAIALSLGGCSEIFPGLNINESHDSHQYQVVSDGDKNQYSVVSTDSGKIPYNVIPITPEVILRLGQQSSLDDINAVPSLLPSNVPPEYRLGPGDVFFVVVWDHPELTAPYTGLTQDLSSQGRLVAADGTTFYPYVGTFKASGMTAGEMRNYLAEHLKTFVQKPQVDVRIVAYRAGRVEITGEVARPGTLNFDDTPKGVLQAIDASGGLTGAASRRRAILVRDGVIHEIDLAGLLSGDRLVPNPELKPGDVLHVPDQSGDQVFVLGAVPKQVPVTIQQDSLTLLQVLNDAGGIDSTQGKDKGILVFRPHRLPDAKVASDIFVMDLSHAEGMLLASQFKLQPRDVVYVKETLFAQYNSVINELLPTVTTIYELNALHQFIK